MQCVCEKSGEAVRAINLEVVVLIREEIEVKRKRAELSDRDTNI